MVVTLGVTFAGHASSFQPLSMRLHRQHSSLRSSSSSLDHDFSSPYFWDEFYEKQLTLQRENNKNEVVNEGDFVFEWHDSIPLEDLAALIPDNSSCLMVGCGNSLLPQVVLDRNDNIPITLLDTSRACLEQLEGRYGTKDVSFVCGSATEMASYFVDDSTTFDCIVDKGLTDAFMCGEGWETPVESLLRESSKLFHPQRGGMYLLVSYKLGPAIQELIQEMCDAASEDLVWEWEFDSQPLSNHRVSVSLARVRPA